MLSKPRILSLYLNSLNKFNKYEHSCKILYNCHSRITYTKRENCAKVHGRHILYEICTDFEDLTRVLMFLLNLLNDLRKRDKMRGLPSILPIFRNEFNKFNKKELEC